MDILQPNAKIFAQRCSLPVRDFIAVFHRWIQQQSVPGLLIDVHDYSHVHHGPGVILVANECHYGMDLAGGALGLSYRARRGEPKPAMQAFRGALHTALGACRVLEEELEGELSFDTNRLQLGCEDRMRAPNTPETLTALEAPLNELASSLFGSDASCRSVGDARASFAVELSGGGTSLAELQARVTP